MHTLTRQERTKLIDRLQKRHPNTRRKPISHAAETYSVQFVDKATGKLVADYNLPKGRNMTYAE